MSDSQTYDLFSRCSNCGHISKSKLSLYQKYLIEERQNNEMSGIVNSKSDIDDDPVWGRSVLDL